MASFKNLVSTTSAQISSGGTITGDLVINGDLQVDGGGSLSFDEIVSGTQVVEITNTEALLVRKASDGGDVFIVDTTNSRVGIGITPTAPLHVATSGSQLNVILGSASQTSTIFNNANSAFGVLDGSTELMRINSSGLGIGTSSPEERIHSTGAIVSTGVNDTGATAGTERAFIDLVSNKARIGHFRGTTSAGSGGLQLYTDSVERASIDASGVLSLKSGRLRLSDNETDNTNKESHIISSQYDTDESEGYMAMRIASNSADNHVSIGGGHADVNASTLIRFFTASNKTTRTGTERMRITSDGKVGINDTPSQALDVTFSGDDGLAINSTTSNANLYLQANGTTKWKFINAPSTHDLYIASESATPLFIKQSNSYVGISTTNPSYALDVSGTIRALGGNLFLSGANSVKNVNNALNLDSASGQHIAMRPNNGSEIARFDSTGLGIGTTSPSVPLHISKATDGGLTEIFINNAASGGSTDETVGIRFTHNQATAGGILAGRTEDFSNSANRSGHLIFKTNHNDSYAERMRIASDGKVGIGITPTVDLDISSSSGDVQARLFRDANVKTSLTFKNSLQEWEIGNSVGDNNKFTIRDITDSRNAFVIDGSGDVSMTGAVLHSSTSSFVGNVGIGSISGSAGGKLLFVDAGDGVADNNDIARFRNQEATDGRNYGVSIIAGSNSTDNSLHVMDKSSNSSLIVKGDGNVGIGTSSPVAKLDIVGTRTLNLTDNITDDNNKNAVITSSQYDSGGETVGFLMMQSFSNASTNRVDIGGGNSGHNSAEEIRFFTGGNTNVRTGTQAMHIDNAQNVLIGSSGSALGTLDVRKASAGDYLYIAGSSDGGRGLTFTSSDVVSGGVTFPGASHNINCGSGVGSLSISVNGSSNVKFKLDSDSRISLGNNDSGTGNTIFGKSTATSLDAGSNYNVFIGGSVATSASISDATHNVGIGSDALQDITTADNNVAIGSSAMLNATTIEQSVAIGRQAMGSGVATGSGNVAIGYASMFDVTSGQNNIGIGSSALGNVLGGNNNIAIGSNSGETMTGVSSTVLIGKQAGEDINNATALGTVAVGHQSLKELTSGAGNTALGYLSLKTVAGGNYNTAVGYEAGENLTQSENTLFGYNAGKLIVSSSRTVLIGAYAGDAINVGDSSADGSVGIGYASLGSLISGGGNTAIGFTSGADVTTGQNNTFVGYQAGNSGSGDVTDGQANTIIGSGATANGSGAINRTAIGRTATAVADNSVTLGNASVTDVYMAQDSGATVHCAGVNIGSFQIIQKDFGTLASGSAHNIGTCGATNFSGKIIMYNNHNSGSGYIEYSVVFSTNAKGISLIHQNQPYFASVVGLNLNSSTGVISTTSLSYNTVTQVRVEILNGTFTFA